MIGEERAVLVTLFSGLKNLLAQGGIDPIYANT
jgi:hypothetical protein